jgi:hypothetical protein
VDKTGSNSAYIGRHANIEIRTARMTVSVDKNDIVSPTQ